MNWGGGRQTEKETRSSTFSLLALRVFKRKGNFIKGETKYELAEELKKKKIKFKRNKFFRRKKQFYHFDMERAAIPSKQKTHLCTWKKKKYSQGVNKGKK